MLIDGLDELLETPFKRDLLYFLNLKQFRIIAFVKEFTPKVKKYFSKYFEPESVYKIDFPPQNEQEIEKNYFKFKDPYVSLEDDWQERSRRDNLIKILLGDLVNHQNFEEIFRWQPLKMRVAVWNWLLVVNRLEVQFPKEIVRTVNYWIARLWFLPD